MVRTETFDRQAFHESMYLVSEAPEGVRAMVSISTGGDPKEVENIREVDWEDDCSFWQFFAGVYRAVSEAGEGSGVIDLEVLDDEVAKSNSSVGTMGDRWDYFVFQVGLECDLEGCVVSVNSG